MRRTSGSITLLTLLVFTLTGAGTVAGTAAEAPPSITRIILEPSSLVLSEPDKGRRVLVTGVDTDGQKLDLTHDAILEPQGNALKLGDDGLIYPVTSGEAKVKVSAAGHSAELSVTVADLSAARPLNFKRDVMPILNKTGCTSGPCHGAAEGKNGFKLSLRGYDPKSDYQALLFELAGRRVNRAAPAESLLFSKPTQGVPHQGGMVLPQPEYRETILRWISEGTVFGDDKKDSVERLEIFPKEIFMARPGIKPTSPGLCALRRRISSRRQQRSVHQEQCRDDCNRCPRWRARDDGRGSGAGADGRGAVDRRGADRRGGASSSLRGQVRNVADDGAQSQGRL